MSREWVTGILIIFVPIAVHVADLYFLPLSCFIYCKGKARNDCTCVCVRTDLLLFDLRKKNVGVRLR